MKSAVKQDHGQHEKAKPEVTAHPGLRAADPPRGYTFPRSKERSKNHEAETGHTEREADGAAAPRSLQRTKGVKNVNHCRHRENCERRNGPAALRLVHSHFAWPWPSMSAKNVRGSTRCAASCGQAYTQLGSFKCVHKSHDVAFCLIAAFLRPVRSGSSIITSNGCKLRSE